MTTIAISELQRSPAQAIKNLRGITTILQNNKQAAALVSNKFLEALDKFGVLDEIEDYLLANDPESIKASQEIENGTAELLNWEQVWK